MNPFLINGYISEDYFCGRLVEAKRIIESVNNGRNITLISLRRMGKSALIQHISRQLPEKDVLLIQLDIYATRNLEEFVLQFGKAVLNIRDLNKKGFFEKLTRFFSGIGASVSFDPLTGQPTVDLKYSGEKTSQKNLSGLINLLEQHSKKVIIAIDEFQQISHYPETNTENFLRTLIQPLQNCRFIFSGSHKQMMLSLFSSHGRPFYQSTELLYLGPIDTFSYAGFIKSWMTKGKKTIEDEDIIYILNWCRHHTWYVQYVCNKIYSSEISSFNKDGINALLAEILVENEPIYLNYKNLLTATQWSVLKAISKEEKVIHPNHSEFIAKYNLGAASSINRALQSLTEKEMIFTDQGYQVYDVFFSRWLQYRGM